VKRSFVLAVSIALAFAACGDGTTGAAVSTTTEVPASTTTGAPDSAAIGDYPVEVDGVVIAARPERILSASATHTEILYAIGAGDRVFATDLFSNYPPEANETEKIDAFNINVEAVAAFDPDLVILTYDPGDVVAGLGTLGIPVLLFGPPVTLDDAFAQIDAIGAAAGLPAEGSALIGEMRDRIDAVVAAIPGDGRRPTYYYELDPTRYSMTSFTFVGGLLGMLGLENVADPADADGYGYPQLGAEFLLDADPDFIFLADTKCCGVSAETITQRPGWDTLSAVVAGRVVELDDDIASRWGPRLVDLVETVAGAVYGAGVVG